MDQFIFSSKYKTVLFGFMGLGVLCLAISFFADAHEFHTRFWTNFLHNATFFTGIAFMGVFILAAFTTALAGWHTLFKRIWEAYSMFLIPGLILMGIMVVATAFHAHHIYHWTDSQAVADDPVLSGKSGFLNLSWYAISTIVIMGLWVFFAWKMRQISLDEDVRGDASYDHHRRLRIWSAAFLPIAGFSSAAVIWQWIMSIDAHWYSTLFAWYVGASWFVSTMALTIIAISFLKAQGYLENVTQEHLHDLGKYLFAFSIFWTYLWFSQYMLIWYGNVGEETVYFQERMENYSVLFYGNVFLNFIAPFFVLMRNDTKRKYGTLVFASIVVFFGHWWDFFQMIKPGARLTAIEAAAHHAGHDGAEHAAGEPGAELAGHTEAASHSLEFAMGYTLPGLLEIGIMLGFLALFIYVFFNRLAKAPLTPKNDPYLQEALHHHVEMHEEEAH